MSVSLSNRACQCLYLIEHVSVSIFKHYSSTYIFKHKKSESRPSACQCLYLIKHICTACSTKTKRDSVLANCGHVKREANVATLKAYVSIRQHTSAYVSIRQARGQRGNLKIKYKWKYKWPLAWHAKRVCSPIVGMSCPCICMYIYIYMYNATCVKMPTIGEHTRLACHAEADVASRKINKK
jgi:hypothetical protein